MLKSVLSLLLLALPISEVRADDPPKIRIHVETAPQPQDTKSFDEKLKRLQDAQRDSPIVKPDKADSVADAEAAKLAGLLDLATNPHPEEVLGPVPASSVIGVDKVVVGIKGTTRTILTITSPILWRGKIDSGHFVAAHTLVGNQLSISFGGVRAGVGYYVVTLTNGDIHVIEVTVVADPQPIPPKPDPTPPPPPDPTPPKPDPTPPKPDPKPDPITPSTLVVVIVEETADAVAMRGAFLADKTLADFMTAKGHKWRVVDKDVVGVDGKPPKDIARFLDLAKQKQLPMMYLVDEKGKIRFESPVPAKASDLIPLLQKWGGK